MPFIEQEAKSEYKEIDGKKVHVITPEVEITLTNTETGTEYMSDKEADDDVDNPSTDTKREHIRRDVHIKVAALKLGADTGKV
jgi:predicted RNA-binding protein with PIN domain|tara:strand:- start:1284 stop:1532 length:249 start_codon:yes stop_codon:yes gene_type:complete